MRPVRGSDRHDGAASLVSADDSRADTTFLEGFIPVGIVGVPFGGSGRKDLEPLRCAVFVGGVGKTAFPAHLTSVTFVAHDAVLASEFSPALELCSGKDPVLRAMNSERSGSIHELSVTPVVTSPEKADARERVFGSVNEVMAPEGREGTVVGVAVFRIPVIPLLPTRQGAP